MHQRLTDGDAVDGAPSATEAFAYGHLAEAHHHIAHDDEQIVDHRGDQENDGKQRHDPAHRLDLWIGGVVFGDLGERIVELHASFLSFGIVAVLCHHLTDVRFQVVYRSTLLQSNIRREAVTTHPTVCDFEI